MGLAGIALWVFSPVINFSLNRIQPVVMENLAKADPHLRSFDRKFLGPALRATFEASYFVLRFLVMYGYPIIAPFLWLLSPIFSWIIIPIVRRFVLPDISAATRYKKHYMPVVEHLHTQQTFQHSHSALNKFILEINMLKTEASNVWRLTLQDRKDQLMPNESSSGGAKQRSDTDAKSFRRRLRNNQTARNEQGNAADGNYLASPQLSSPPLASYNAGASHMNWATGPASPIEKSKMFSQ